MLLDGLPKHKLFQSTPLSRGATGPAWVGVASRCISIHAPLARSDQSKAYPQRRQRHFNPRPSREERLDYGEDYGEAVVFQSTPLSRGATVFFPPAHLRIMYFNPRPSREERLEYVRAKALEIKNFNPRPSREERQQNRTKPLPVFRHST